MTRRLTNQPNTPLPRKIHTRLDVLSTRRVDNIDRIPLSRTSIICIRQACIVIPIMMYARDGVFGVIGCGEPVCLDSGAGRWVVGRLVGMAEGAWWCGLDETAGEGAVQFFPG